MHCTIAKPFKILRFFRVCLNQNQPGGQRQHNIDNIPATSTTTTNLVLCHRCLFSLLIPSKIWFHTVKFPSSIGPGEAKISSSHLHHNQHNHRQTTNPDPHVRLMALARSMCSSLTRRTRQQIFACDLRRQTQNHSTHHMCSCGAERRSC